MNLLLSLNSPTPNSIKENCWYLLCIYSELLCNHIDPNCFHILSLWDINVDGPYYETITKSTLNVISIKYNSICTRKCLLFETHRRSFLYKNAEVSYSCVRWDCLIKVCACLCRSKGYYKLIQMIAGKINYPEGNH